MAEAWRLLRSGAYLFARSTQRRLAYVESFLIDLGAFLAIFGLSVLLWRAVHLQGAAFPLAWESLLAYLALAFAVMSTMELGVGYMFGNSVRSGTIAIDLIKPLPLSYLYFCESMSWALLQLGYASLALLCFTPWLPSLPLPQDAAHWGVLGLSMFLAASVQFGIIFCFAQGSFITQFGYGLFYTRLMLHQVFCGAFAPVEMFPEALRPWAMALPFRHVVDTPVRIAMGMAAPEAWGGMLLEQALWALGLIALAQLIFKAMLSRVQIQGG